MKLRSGWPLALFVVLLVAVPILEVYVLVQVGQRIGVGPTILILVLEAVLGGWLMRREGARTWRALDGAFRGGRVPTGELADAALVLVGGVLLMLPGFVTDVFGLFFLIPFTRPFARTMVAFFVARRLSRSGIAPGSLNRYGTGAGGAVIPGEVVPDATTVTVTPDQIESGRPPA
ncbi:MAG: protein FxsA [Microbacteriaceae bacterium]|nr:protein FxsA [Microbacteriaceae bacterium]